MTAAELDMSEAPKKNSTSPSVPAAGTIAIGTPSYTSPASAIGVGEVLATIIRISPFGMLLLLSGDSDKNIDNQTADDGTPVADLRPMPKNKIEELGGEGYTAPLKKGAGGSKSNLYWNPRTGRVYTVPNGGGPPQWRDTVTPNH